jgi:hypothetical protein
VGAINPWGEREINPRINPRADDPAGAAGRSSRHDHHR